MAHSRPTHYYVSLSRSCFVACSSFSICLDVCGLVPFQYSNCTLGVCVCVWCVHAPVYPVVCLCVSIYPLDSARLPIRVCMFVCVFTGNIVYVCMCVSIIVSVCVYPFD